MAAVQEAAAVREGAPDEADPADRISRPWWREDASPAQLVGSELFRHQTLNVVGFDTGAGAEAEVEAMLVARDASVTPCASPLRNLD